MVKKEICVSYESTRDKKSSLKKSPGKKVFPIADLTKSLLPSHKKIILGLTSVIVLVGLIALLFNSLKEPLAGKAFGIGSTTLAGCTAAGGQLGTESSVDVCFISTCTTIGQSGVYRL